MPVGPQVERTDARRYPQDGRSGLRRERAQKVSRRGSKQLRPHLKGFFDACAKARVVNSDWISALSSRGGSSSARSPATVNYELAGV